jgi:hypothetical protein
MVKIKLVRILNIWNSIELDSGVTTTVSNLSSASTENNTEY